jgi:hypothetical protein
MVKIEFTIENLASNLQDVLYEHRLNNDLFNELQKN